MKLGALTEGGAGGVQQHPLKLTGRIGGWAREEITCFLLSFFCNDTLKEKIDNLTINLN